MQVFISWSGELSRQLAEAIRDWLPSALQFVRPYFTPADIDKGTKWASEISAALSSSSICIIVLTRDNLQSKWIMFEAGAISSTLDNNRVCPILFDLKPTDLQGPLAQFQVTRFLEEDFRKLFNTVNFQGGEQRLSDPIAQSVFEKWWPDLNKRISEILHGHCAKSDVKTLRTDRALLEEILLLSRKQSSEKEPPRRLTNNEFNESNEYTIIKRFSTVLGYLAEERNFNTDLFHRLLRIERNFAIRTLSEGALKTAHLNDLEELILRFRPKAISGVTDDNKNHCNG